ncbi:MAG: glycosyltransferase family 4 protein [Candidatus Doudnabacteria bacterium]|nr:glycosyltransferase family 4 protein [Candidatus Doudnabacteria bacterium]
MRILFTVEFYFPHKGGAEFVVQQLAERAQEAGHAVTVATTALPERAAERIHGVSVESFALSGNSVRGVSGSEAEKLRYKEFLLSGFDVVINYAAQTWTSDLAFEIVSELAQRSRMLFVPCGYSGLHNPEYKAYFSELPQYLRQYHKLVYMSEHYQDKLFGDSVGLSDKAVIIPNGAGEEEFSRPAAGSIRSQLQITTPYMLLCVSNHYRAKGHAFVLEAFRRMGRTDTTLVLIGDNPGTSAVSKLKQWIFGCIGTCVVRGALNSRVRMLQGVSRGEVIAAYQEADLFLFGSEIECAPLVLYESFASRTCFISRPVGNVPEYASLVRLVATPQSMADTANRLLADPKLRLQLTEQAYTAWQQFYTWDKITKQYLALCQK